MNIQDTSQFNEDFIKSGNEEGDKGCFVKVDVQHNKKLHELHNDLPFLPERMKIEELEKVEPNLRDKTENIIHIINLKKLLNHRVIKFNQNAWLKPYIGMDRDLRERKEKMTLKEISFKSMNNAGFETTMEIVRKHWDIKLNRTETRRNYLKSEPIYPTTKFLTEYLLAIEMKKNAYTYE